MTADARPETEGDAARPIGEREEREDVGASGPRAVPRTWADPIAVGAVALALRVAVALWAMDAIPPTADGTYYHQLATRLAEGHGYTWLWPDGVVTYAAHYPVGYPAIVAVGYWLFGAKPVVAMILNAIVGAAASVATWSLVARASPAMKTTTPTKTRRLALLAGLAAALHPALLPYTAAIMTEGMTASLLVVAAALAAHARDARAPARWLAVTGVVMGVATLVRPQSLVLAPVLGWLAVSGAAPRRAGVDATGRARPALGAALVTILALGTCAPWTARNCARMETCALVSVNGGWNLAIGAQTDDGSWRALAVPEACKTVFQEAAKDACFGREALKVIAASPGRWLARAPAKLRATFDYFGAAPWYLHAANAARFSYRMKVALGAIETLASRLLLVAALVAVFRTRPSTRSARDRLRRGLAVFGMMACVLVPGTLGYLALACAVAALGWRAATRDAPLVVPFTAAVVLATAATHAVFFGAGRYGLVVVPFVTALAFVRASGVNAALAVRGRRNHAAGVDAVQAIAGGVAPRGEPSREESPSSGERDAG